MKLDADVFVTAARASIADETIILIAWQVEEGQRVFQGQKLCEIETSKSVIEIHAHRQGWLFHSQSAGDEVPVNEALGIISDLPQKPTLAQMSQGANGRSGLATSRGSLSMLGSGIQPRGGRVVNLSPRERGVALAISRSHADIPQGMQSRWLDAEKCHESALALDEASGPATDMENLFLKACVEAALAVPKANACWSDHGLTFHESVNLGMVINQPNGDLLAPVIHAAETLPSSELIKQANELRAKAKNQKLSVEEMGDGTILCMSMLGTGVQQVYPFVGPGNSLIANLGDEFDGRYCISICFDHRIMNDLEAGAFLASLAREMESGA